MKLHHTAAPSSEAFDLLNCEAVDGDTIKAVADVGLGVLVKIRIRLRSFYAPELNGAMPDQGWAAKTLLDAFLAQGRCQLKKRGSKMDQNGRWLGWLLRDGHLAEGDVVLGAYNLSVEAHAADLKAQRRNQGRTGGAL